MMVWENHCIAIKGDAREKETIHSSQMEGPASAWLFLSYLSCIGANRQCPGWPPAHGQCNLSGSWYGWLDTANLFYHPADQWKRLRGLNNHNIV
ncbi:hypothetical protein AA18889_2417 [Acetobacter senegalensis DSM 18889]|nr:hypothetical protein AA18889_2417 [Acetobacter senegalensis DSM 18889]